MKQIQALVTIDPGIRGVGIAYFNLGTLARASYVRNPFTTGNDFRAADGLRSAVFNWIDDTVPGDLSPLLIVEVPKVYPSARQKGDQNDLVALAGFAYALSTIPRIDRAERVFPRDWKGTVPADIMLNRIESKLSPHEVKRIDCQRETVRHNCLDAVGIGLHCLGRLK